MQLELLYSCEDYGDCDSDRGVQGKICDGQFGWNQVLIWQEKWKLAARVKG